MPSMGRQCEIETSWHVFCAKNGGGFHTIVHNECTISHFFQFFCILLLHVSVMFIVI